MLRTQQHPAVQLMTASKNANLLLEGSLSCQDWFMEWTPEPHKGWTHLTIYSPEKLTKPHLVKATYDLAVAGFAVVRNESTEGSTAFHFIAKWEVTQESYEDQAADGSPRIVALGGSSGSLVR
jgi:hypothetical protein